MADTQPAFHRRALIAALAATLLPASAPAIGTNDMPETTSLTRPPRLRRGDTIGLVAPSGATYEADDRALVEEVVRALGFVPKHGAHTMDRYGYLAGQDRDRAADVNAMFADREVKALLCVRGGWGAARMLPFLDYEMIAANPKAVLGYSDITGLHMALQARAGMVSFHGANAANAWGPISVASFNEQLVDAGTPLFRNPVAREDRLVQRRGRTVVLGRGKARGRLIGGNLTVFSALAGTPYMPDTRGAILVLEDTNEAEYRIDRMLTQLALAGILPGLAGFVFGQCTDCRGEGGGYGNFTLSEILDQHIRPLGIPAFHGAMFGHIADQPFLPLGADVEIDADAGTMQVLAPAVV
ncbi:MAG: LD-carboxypeptidase [Hyphomonadaceae bacterium]|jgi:muramoyltetrapeptide carboxypeptidase|nr:LD-carboxypeptidase [Hyphomonadaceae bacterium]